MKNKAIEKSKQSLQEAHLLTEAFPAAICHQNVKTFRATYENQDFKKK